MKTRPPFGERGGSIARAIDETRELARGLAEEGEIMGRSLGVPALFAIGASAVGSSVYLVLGVVAGDALALTPLVFLAAGAFFVVTMLTYAEGNSVHGERGGASTFARYAFNELWSFVAGWAILLDYLIVMAVAALALSHYLTPFWSQAGDAGIEIAIAAAAIGYVVHANVRGLTAERFNFTARLGLVNGAVLIAVVAIGLALHFDADLITDAIELGSAPRWTDLLFAAVVATLAVTGIEAASGLAGELRVPPARLRRVVAVGGVAVIALYVGISLVAVTAVPVRGGATELAGRFLEAPVLGIVGVWEPAWLSDAFRYLLAVVAAVVLIQALNGSMLGISRLGYSLAINRQIPRTLGRLHPERSTPYLVIGTAGILALALVASSDLEFLVGLYAFGSMLAVLIAHVAVIALRYREPDVQRTFAIPLPVRIGAAAVPIPALLGALAALAAWVSVIVLHEGARIAGTAWMAGGLALYVLYRRGQGESLTERFTVTPAALQEAPEIEYGSILVPVFGTRLDDDIVGTAGRLAAERNDDVEGGALIEALYVVEVPMSLPLDARIPDEQIAAARRALARAKEVGEEYEGVEVATATARARTIGQAIVDEARRRGVEAIVLAAEAPSRVRGGGALGGRGHPRDRAAGEMTRHVLEKAPCRVILTAAPAGEEGEREGVAP
ncbi:MAG: amino acid permease [Actinomycetota bacterium]|nr:amino acid permease [Actinomycetota bacterium]